MLGFSLAFAMPFTLFAYFPEIMKKLPKSGSWLNTVKVILGFLELALGLKFLSVADQTYHWHLLDRETYLAIWIAIGIMLTMYLLGKLKLPNDSETSNIKVPRLILAILTLSFVVYLIPGMFGAPLKALAGYIPPITTQDFVLGKNVTTVTESKSTLCNTPKYSDKLHLPYGIEAYFDYNEALQCAKNQNKPLLLIFTGHGCVNCRKMEENVWSDEGVQNMMKNNFVICALYTDDRTMSEDGVKTIGEVNTELEIANYQMSAQPYYVIENPNQPGKAVKEPMKYNPDIENFKQFLDIKK
jgi:thiol:disulfide interchange protein DsbD